MDQQEFKKRIEKFKRYIQMTTELLQQEVQIYEDRQKDHNEYQAGKQQAKQICLGDIIQTIITIKINKMNAEEILQSIESKLAELVRKRKRFAVNPNAFPTDALLTNIVLPEATEENDDFLWNLLTALGGVGKDSSWSFSKAISVSSLEERATILHGLAQLDLSGLQDKLHTLQENENHSTKPDESDQHGFGTDQEHQNSSAHLSQGGDVSPNLYNRKDSAENMELTNSQVMEIASSVYKLRTAVSQNNNGSLIWSQLSKLQERLCNWLDDQEDDHNETEFIYDNEALLFEPLQELLQLLHGSPVNKTYPSQWAFPRYVGAPMYNLLIRQIKRLLEISETELANIAQIEPVVTQIDETFGASNEKLSMKENVSPLNKSEAMHQSSVRSRKRPTTLTENDLSENKSEYPTSKRRNLGEEVSHQTAFEFFNETTIDALLTSMLE